MEAALGQAERAAAYKGLAGKDAIALRLLTEEMLGMMRALTGETEGLFWIEDEDGEYRLHLQTKARLTGEERERLLAVSTTGKNESAKGLMGRIRDFFDWGSDGDLAGVHGAVLMPEMYEHSSSPALDWEWSMARMEAELAGRISEDSAAKEQWDELEKSVVSHVADDVRVSIRGGKIELVILKKIGNSGKG